MGETREERLEARVRELEAENDIMRLWFVRAYGQEYLDRLLYGPDEPTSPPDSEPEGEDKIMGDRSQWPQWLRAAHTSNAEVEITSRGRVLWYGGEWYGGVWHDGEWYDGLWCDGEWCGGLWYGGVWRGGEWRGGVWYGGLWYGGVWHDGEWYDGLWCDGEWYGGEWYGGEWYGGRWHDGEWHDGEWCGGLWYGGVWHGGRTSAGRAMYNVTGDGAHIWIGCHRATPDQWEQIIHGHKSAPIGAPARGSEAWRLLVAAYRAQVAYQQSLAQQEESDG